jgi:asparagine synthase (glutamine-hydrolysing)
VPLTERHRLTALEVASGYLFGTAAKDRRDAAPLQTTPLEALEASTRKALLRPPCLVAFSGGRDSSAILAVAAAVARREGLPLPIPITFRFPEAAEAGESEWQERVVAALALEDWTRLEITHELDSIGPYARRVLRRHGLLWPPNAHLLVPLLEAAAPGSLLTGNGGDQYLAASGPFARAAAVLARRLRPEPRDVLRVALALSPRRARRALLVRRHPEAVRAPWLREPARAQVHAAWAHEQATEPLRDGPRVLWTSRLRAAIVGRGALELLAADAGVLLAQPFDDDAFIAALARDPGLPRAADRTEQMRRLFGGLLPNDVCARPTKAGFRHVFWNRHSASFATSWSGAGADPTLVDLDRLRSLWTSPEAPNHFRSATQLQAAWLAESADGTQKEPTGLGEGIEPARPAELPAGQTGQPQ